MDEEEEGSDEGKSNILLEVRLCGKFNIAHKEGKKNLSTRLSIANDKHVKICLPAAFWVFYVLLYLYLFSLTAILNLPLAPSSPDSDLSTSEFQEKRGKKNTAKSTFAHCHVHTNSELIISTLIMLLILRLPADSAIYPVSPSRGRRVMSVMCAGVRSG